MVSFSVQYQGKPITGRVGPSTSCKKKLITLNGIYDDCPWWMNTGSPAGSVGGAWDWESRALPTELAGHSSDLVW